MKFSATQNVMSSAIAKVAGVPPTNSMNPVTTHLLMDAEDGEVVLTATDLEVELTCSFKAEVDEPGQLLVPARKLNDLVRGFSSEALVSISIDDEKCVVKSGKSRYTLPTLPAKEFPTFSDNSGGEARANFKIKAAALRSVIDRTFFAAASNDVRHYLNGLLLELDGETVRVIGTDGHRLGLAETVCTPGDGAPEFSVILPRKGVTEIQRVLKAENDEVSVYLTATSARIEAPGCKAMVKLIDGKFPDYKAVVPAVVEEAVEINREELISAINRLCQVGDPKKGNLIRLEVDGGRVLIEGGSHKSAPGAGFEEIATASEASHKLKFGVNGAYLRDSVSALADEQVRVQARGGNTAILITSPDTSKVSCRQVVMPLKP